jgi:hypothetical protein
VSLWFGLVRHPHFLGQILMQWSWALLTGTEAPCVLVVWFGRTSHYLGQILMLWAAPAAMVLKLLLSGWFGSVWHPHYLGQILMQWVDPLYDPWIQDMGWDGKNSDPGSETNIQDPQHCTVWFSTTSSLTGSLWPRY